MELEENKSIPFLDILISKKEDGSLSHQVYQKLTHSDRYLHANSHHHPTQKCGIINTLVTRALRQGTHWTRTKTPRKNVFKENGYSKKEFDKVVIRTKRRSNTKSIDENKQGKSIILPYIKGTTNTFANILKKGNIKVSFSPPNTIKNLLDHAKDSIEPKKEKKMCIFNTFLLWKIVHRETERSIQIRLSEHCADLRHNRINKSALAEHSHNTGHHICVEDTKIISRMHHYGKRKICEAMEIELN